MQTASMALTGKFIKAINPLGHAPAGFHIEAAGSVCIRKEKGKMRKEQLMCLSVISLRAGNTEKGIFIPKNSLLLSGAGEFSKYSCAGGVIGLKQICRKRNNFINS